MEAAYYNWKEWRPGILATLVFVVKGGRILLIEKKRGLGAGKINGPGGKIDDGETPMECAIRETHEELLVTPLQIRKVGELRFAMTMSPHILCHVYRANDLLGEPCETEEAKPLWTEIGSIPYHRMWEDDRHWLPYLLSERGFLGRFVFSGETMCSMDLRTDLTWD